MRAEEPRVIRLADYRPPDYLIDRVDLDISLEAAATRVVSVLSLRPNPAATEHGVLALDGDGLSLSAQPLLDDLPLDADAFRASPTGFVLANPPARGERVKIFNQMTETHRVRDLAELVAKVTGARVAYLPNPRKEAAENDLVVKNDQFVALGLEPTTLAEGLLTEVVDVARKFAYRVDRSRIPAFSAWTARSIASVVLFEPAPAMTGTRPLTCATTISTTRLCSSWESVGLSPVVPTGTSPVEPFSICQSTNARSAASSILPLLNGVTRAGIEPVRAGCLVMRTILRRKHGVTGRHT